MHKIFFIKFDVAKKKLRKIEWDAVFLIDKKLKSFLMSMDTDYVIR